MSSRSLASFTCIGVSIALVGFSFASGSHARAIASQVLAHDVGAVSGASARTSADARDESKDAQRIEYDRDIRPILSNACFTCHGPDANKRKADLRLDSFAGATAQSKSGTTAIAPGDCASSELVRRITSSDADEHMPPAASGKALDPREIELVERWITTGAPYQPHWSFVAPVRVDPPHASEARIGEKEAENVIDRFVSARIAEEGLQPTRAASKETLIRRVTLDLTGLPPTLAEIDAFVADARPDAYEHLVDRLLASKRYAENEARYWLDQARYGDTHGYHLDNERQVWRWREWVIDAFDRNEPFDQFALDQLAGDLLPNATLQQKIATGFNRCNPTTGEGGLIAEEYLAKYAMDRVDTTSAVFLGLTMGCCQCHDHKFDPLTQREYYSMYAYFGSLAEQASDENAIAPPPAIRAPDERQAAELDRLTRARDEAKAKLEAPMPEIDAEQPAWEERTARELALRFRAIVPTKTAQSGGSTLTIQADASLLASGTNPAKDVYELEFDGSFGGTTLVQLEALTHDSLPLKGAGRAYNSNFVLTGFEVEARGADGAWKRVQIARALADHSQKDFPVAAAIDDNAQSGWAVSYRPENRLAWFAFATPLAPDVAHLRVRLRHESQFEKHAIGHFRLSVSNDTALTSVASSPWSLAGPFRARTGKEAFDRAFIDEPRVDFTQLGDDAHSLWTPHPEFVDGQGHTFQGDNSCVYLARTIASPEARRVTCAIGSDDALKVWLNGKLVHSNERTRALTLGEDKVVLDLVAGTNVVLLKVANYTGGFAFAFALDAEEIGGMPLPVIATLERDPSTRSESNKKILRDHHREFFSPAWARMRDAAAISEKARAEFEATVPMCMISQDLVEPRPSFVLIRGQYDKKGEPVEAGVPAALPPLPSDAPKNRLALARWLVDPKNPLTARVAVNRMWARHFGTGIVATTRDFGVRGEWPSHRELLDWLATEFVRTGWDMKRMHALIVTSAAYRRDSRATEDALRVDPANRLLARGPRMRLDAEVIRDSALFESGLLVEKVGGPSVKPYQPEGLWEVVAYPTSNTAKFVQDHGDALYRRSLYTFWKRTSPPPSMTTFDAPSRETCTVERARTNTPLQALCLLNDVQFVEAARALAQRTIVEGGANDTSRVEFAFRLVTSRAPKTAERDVLLAMLTEQRANFRANPANATALVSVGESRSKTVFDPSELAAWTVVAQTLLNLDEVVTRG